MTSYTVAAPIGDNPSALFVGLRGFPTKKIVLISQPEYSKEITKLKEDLGRFQLPVQTRELLGDPIESMFNILGDLKKSEGEESLLVNVSTGDRISTCAAVSACYVNGLRAFAVVKNEPRLLPMLKLSYTKVISDSKMRILKVLQDHEDTLNALGEKLKMTPPLVSYHLNGDRGSFGLIELGLVETTDQGREKTARLAEMGRLFVKGLL